MTTKTPRGPYAKGIARRAEILKIALEVYQSSGRQGPTLRSIAAAVGVTEAAVLHYFDSKDDLLVAILEERDRTYGETYDLATPDGVLALMEHTIGTPGLVKLFVDMSAAAADPQHPAHRFMRRRSEELADLGAQMLGPGHEWQTRVLVAAMDGLQLQWLRDPTVDVVGDLKRLYRALTADDVRET
ncbi:TetR/AcrR family transcriptional regulator [Streptomyces sp. NBC_00038]|uniref:TetR/AcrR family transcriptional regulator n=1 Tax=Streptomyces sp. NBC_00038 TaxID=2903615 RepID=UPI00224E27D2|nr:TetR/AcrR family transcriptional regulator [Streptomyces sp. NBC_00038]MCX5561384.1 TetR/AcrR family transcriptional regulator [Streptomyces sp. NBC_00038]